MFAFREKACLSQFKRKNYPHADDIVAGKEQSKQLGIIHHYYKTNC